MLLNYFKITLRVFLKNKLFTTINVLGLAIGIAVYILITQYVSFELKYDQHLSHIDDLYRVTLTSNLGGKGYKTMATNHPAVAYAMKEDFPEVESYARLVDRNIMWGTFVLSYEDQQGNLVKTNINEEQLFIADSTVMDLFDIKLIKGHSETALTEGGSIILSEEVAQRFFGTEDPIGKMLRFNNRSPFTVTGVFENLPENTHFRFNMLVSFSSLGPWTEQTWIWPDFYNYVKLKPGTDPAVVEAKFPGFAKKYLSEIMQEHGFEARFGLQPVKDIHLKSHHINEVSANTSENTLYFLQVIAFFVILIALMNFINLSTAKSTERAMEVGLKKVVGIRKSALIIQFLLESLAINLISIILAIGLVSIFIQPFNELVGLEILSLGMWADPMVWMHLLVVLFVGGILAGAYPAFVLSGFKPIAVLKGRFHQSNKGVSTRRTLVITQFAISIALITGTFIIHNQFSYMQDQELGYDVEHNLVINAPTVIDSTIGRKMETFKGELLRDPKINAITVTKDIPGKKIALDNIVRQAHERKEEGVNCDFLNIDHDFLKTYQIKLLAGRNFRLGDATSYDRIKEMDNGKTHRVMINKVAAQTLGFQTLEDAINKKIIFPMLSDGTEGIAEIIGVVDNYHQESLQTDYYPIIYQNYSYYDAAYITVNMNTSNAQQTIANIGEKFGEFFPLDPYNYFFLEDHFNRQYESDVKFGYICLLFSILAIFIAALGLFGLGSYMAVKKTKELCIRKVLGANLTQVIILIPKSLLTLVLLSGLIATPISYFFANEWLSDYAFRTALSPWMFIIPISLVLGIAALSVLPECIKAAVVNPAKYLKDE